ncbi:MAG: glycosyltransferase family 2 protein [Candidatus Cryptobacteroides sp.]
MEKKKISVIIPCYKGENCIARALDSVYSQGYDNLEVIVIIDGLVDNAREIASQYPAKIIVFEESRGVSAARNAGIKIAEGEYIHFMDVDDELSTGFYNKMVEAAGDIDPDVVASGVYDELQHHKSQYFSRRRVVRGTYRKLTVTWGCRLPSCWRYLFKTDLLRKHKLEFEEGRIIEDLQFTTKALYFAKEIVTAPGAIYIYNATPNSITTTRTEAQKKRIAEDFAHATRLIKEFGKEHGFIVPCRANVPFKIVFNSWMHYQRFLGVIGLGYKRPV